MYTMCDLSHERPQERVPSGCVSRPYELQVLPPPLPCSPTSHAPAQSAVHVAVSTRGRGARSVMQPESALEIASQRASQETDRFRLPACLADSNAAGVADASMVPLDEEHVLWRTNYEARPRLDLPRASPVTRCCAGVQPALQARALRGDGAAESGRRRRRSAQGYAAAVAAARDAAAGGALAHAGRDGHQRGAGGGGCQRSEQHAAAPGGRLRCSPLR